MGKGAGQSPALVRCDAAFPSWRWYAGTLRRCFPRLALVRWHAATLNGPRDADTLNCAATLNGRPGAGTLLSVFFLEAAMELGDIWGGSGFMDYSVMWIVSRFLVKVGALVCGLYKGANGLGDGAGRGCCCCCCCCQDTCTFLICLWNILDHTYTSYYFGSRTNVIGKGLLLRMAFTNKTFGICFLHRRYRHVFFSN